MPLITTYVISDRKSGGLPGWEIAIISVATGVGVILLLVAVYKLVLTQSGAKLFSRNDIVKFYIKLPKAACLVQYNLYSSFI